MARGYTKALTQGAAADLRRGPVPLGSPRRRRLHPGPAGQPGAPRHRRACRFYPDLEGAVGRTPHLLGRRRAMLAMMDAAPDRVARLRHRERRRHADLRARQVLHRRRHLDLHRLRQLQPPLVDPRLRALRGGRRHRGGVRRTAAPHPRRRAPRPRRRPRCRGATASTPTTCTPSSSGRPPRLDDWYAAGQPGPRPPGRLRRLQPPDLPRLKRALALPLYLRLHDPDGRPGPLRKKDEF